MAREPDAVRAATPPRPRGPDIIRNNKGQQARPRGIDMEPKSNRVKFSEKKKNYDYKEEDDTILEGVKIAPRRPYCPY